MEWLTNAFLAHVGWALGEAVIGLLLLAILGSLYLLAAAPRMIRQARCRHDRYHETSACDAICTECGKNLGFIGSWRDKQRSLARDLNQPAASRKGE